MVDYERTPGGSSFSRQEMKSGETCGVLHVLGTSEKGPCVSDLGDVRKAQVRTIFERLAPQYDAVGPACFAYFGRRLVDEVGIESGQRVLDVACGRGAVLFLSRSR